MFYTLIKHGFLINESACRVLSTLSEAYHLVLGSLIGQKFVLSNKNNIKFPRGNYPTNSSSTETFYCLYR